MIFRTRSRVPGRMGRSSGVLFGGEVVCGLVGIDAVVISARQREPVLGYIKAGTAEGAKVAVGGKKPEHLKKGYYVEPTILTDGKNTMKVAQEEIFGPVLVVRAVAD